MIGTNCRVFTFRTWLIQTHSCWFRKCHTFSFSFHLQDSTENSNVVALKEICRQQQRERKRMYRHKLFYCRLVKIFIFIILIVIVYIMFSFHLNISPSNCQSCSRLRISSPLSSFLIFHISSASPSPLSLQFPKEDAKLLRATKSA